MHSGSKQLKIGAVLSYLSIVLNVLGGLFYTPWMVQQIGQSQYGLFTLVNSLISLFTVDFGLSSATSRFVSNYRAAGETKKINDFLGLIYKLFLLIDLAIFTVLIVIYFCIDSIYLQLTAAELQQFKTVYIIAAAYSIISFPFLTLNGILNAHEKFVQLKLADIIYRVFTIVFMVLALWAGAGLYALVAVNAAVGLAVIVYKLIVIRKTTAIKVNFRHTDLNLSREIFGFSFWITIAGLAQRLIFNITPSILGWVANAATIAVFGVVTAIEGYAYTFSSAINGMFMPRISRIYQNSDPGKQLMPLMMAVGRFQFAINGLIVAGFTVVGEAFIRLWMGEAYRDAYYGIVLVIVPGLFFNAMQIANTAILVTEHAKQYAYVNLLMGAVNIILSPMLSRSFGVIGACASIFIAYTIRAIGLNVLYGRKLGLDMWYFARHCYLRISAAILLTIAVGLGMNHFIGVQGWLSLILEACILTLVYGVFLFVFCVNDRRAWIKKVIGLCHLRR